MELSKEEYINLVKKLADEGSSAVFANASVDNAVVITQEMLKKAEKSVNILSSNLHKELFFDKIKTELTVAAKSISIESAIKIITVAEWKDEDDIPKAVKEINAEIGTNVIELSSLAGEKRAEKVGHFSVVDGKSWRIEKPHAPLKEGEDKVNAIVCFNDEKTGSKLVANFNEWWEISKNSNESSK